MTAFMGALNTLLLSARWHAVASGLLTAKVSPTLSSAPVVALFIYCWCVNQVRHGASD